jgi:hypothetical protein
LKNVGLAWVVLALHASDNPIAGSDNVTTFQRLNPTTPMKTMVINLVKFNNTSVVAHLEPLRSLNDYGFFTVLHLISSICGYFNARA